MNFNFPFKYLFILQNHYILGILRIDHLWKKHGLKYDKAMRVGYTNERFIFVKDDHKAVLKKYNI